jgi:hypothetical protein
MCGNNVESLNVKAGVVHVVNTLDGGEWSASRPSSFTSWKEHPVLTGWAPEPVWTTWR